MSAFFRILCAAAAIVVILERTTANRRYMKGSEKYQEADISSYPVDPSLFPYYFFMYLLIIPVIASDKMLYVCSLFFGIVIDMGIYYAVVVIFRSIIKHRFSGKVSSVFWILPNFMYLLVLPATTLLPEKIIILSKGQWAVVILTWAAGFLMMLCFSILGHFRFRNNILESAVEEKDEKILELLKQELENLDLSIGTECLVRSSRIKVPLTIGLFKKKIRLVLPDAEYDENELRMIFRHELIHLYRKDNAAKFYLSFITALNWFNPFVWKAMSAQAEDIEKSCDESILFASDINEKKEYAELILRAGGDMRGFTTCLSSSKKSMKERLRSMMSERKSAFGWLWLCLAASLLIIFGGRSTIGISEGTLSECLKKYKEAGTIENAAVIDYSQIGQIGDLDESLDLWIECFSEVPIAKVANEYWEYSDPQLWVGFYFENQVYSLTFAKMADGLMIRDAKYKDHLTQGVYYAEGMTIEQVRMMLGNELQ